MIRTEPGYVLCDVEMRAAALCVEHHGITRVGVVANLAAHFLAARVAEVLVEGLVRLVNDKMARQCGSQTELALKRVRLQSKKKR